MIQIRGTIPFIALSALLLSPVNAGRAETGPPLPNIIFIVADDLGYGQLGCYGQQKIRTPCLDRMASEGLRFTQFYSGQTVCAPSRSVLMTGYHTGHTSVRINGGGSALLPEDVTVAEVLKKAGYATGIFGKWGLGDEGSDGVPNRQGFDEFFGYLNQVHAHFYYTHFLWKNETKFAIPENEGEKHARYSHDLIADAALDFIRRHRDQRFFAYIPFTIPHFELLVPEDSMKEYDGAFPEPYPYEGNGHYAAQSKPRAAMAAMITRMDRDVGRIFALLKELGIDRNTIVFFTSDNGNYYLGGPQDFFKSNRPLRGGKEHLYEGGIRVPLVVRWPGKVPAGKTDDLIWAFWDILPTLAELGGGQAPSGIDGISVLPRVLGKPMAAPDRYLYWEIIPGNEGGRVQPWMVAVRHGKWKALRRKPTLPIELYDLESDIGETKNVAGEHPEVIQDIEAYLKTARTFPRTYPPQEPNWGYPRLKTGYVK
jgi:arylsulfatase A